MGQKNIKTIDLTEDKPATTAEAAKQAETNEEEEVSSQGKPKQRSQRYQQLRQAVDKTRHYSIDEALAILTKAAKTTNFDETVELHLTVKKTGIKGELQLPHQTGQSLNVAVFEEALLKKIKAKDIEFDILLAKPKDMPKILPHAKFLGPKGLIPNPKNNTLVDDPAARKKELEAGVYLYQTEPKAPIMHLSLGKISLGANKLKQNYQALISDIGIHQIKQASICTTMSPSLKLALK